MLVGVALLELIIMIVEYNDLMMGACHWPLDLLALATVASSSSVLVDHPLRFILLLHCFPGVNVAGTSVNEAYCYLCILSYPSFRTPHVLLLLVGYGTSLLPWNT